MDLKATAKTREGWILSRIVKSRFLLLQCSIIRVLVFIMQGNRFVHIGCVSHVETNRVSYPGYFVVFLRHTLHFRDSVRKETQPVTKLDCPKGFFYRFAPNKFYGNNIKQAKSLPKSSTIQTQPTLKIGSCLSQD